MKRNLNLPTVFVVLLTILFAGGCDSADDPDNQITYPDKVTIYLKLHIEDGKKYLEMYDSANPASSVINDLHTDVGPATKVIWKRTEDSGIRSIKKVGPKEEGGPIFPGDATTILLNKRFRIKVPKDAPVPTGEIEYIEEAYDIIFVEKETGEEIKIDPYLRIPKQL